MTITMSDTLYYVDVEYDLPSVEKRELRKKYGLNKPYRHKHHAERKYSSLPIEIQSKCEVTEGFEIGF